MRNRIVCLLVLAAAATCLSAQDQAPAQPTQPQQTPPQPAQPQPAQPNPTTPQPQEAAAPPAPAPPPQPTAEPNFTGDIEFGYRFIANTGGSFNTYRSVVDLGEGPKLFGADATLLNPKGRFFDRLDLHLTSIGDDPYETAKLDISKRNWYRLTVDWRNIAYFNYLPSFANPFQSIGSTLDANSYDTHIHNTDVRLDIMPGGRYVPYLAYGGNSQGGSGLTSFVVSENAYPVATSYASRTDSYRGGVDFNFARFHANLEEGGTTFRDDQGASDSAPNSGFSTSTFLGQQLVLNTMNELYRVRGDSVYSKGSFAANPISWATISGQFVYAEPRVNVTYDQNSTGNFYYTELVQFYTTGQSAVTGSANMPHPSGSLNVELRPWKRVRIVDFWMTDRQHNASSDLLTEMLLLSSGPLTPSTLSSARLQENYNQQEVDVFFDLTSRITIRGGDRYVWGDATLTAPLLVEFPNESGHLSQNVGIVGLSYRLARKTRVNVDYEVSNSTQAYFRTSLRDYTKFRVRGSHDITPSLRVAVDYSLLTNSNPDPLINYDFSSHAGSVSLNWLPKGGKWVTALLDYTRTSVQSSILYLVPATLGTATSLYHENAHTGTALISVKWFSAGGSLFISAGSRPTQYYQPLARVSVPIYKHLYWNAEWRYYGFAEQYYQFEGFRSNQLMTSLRLVR
jgi:hypothetical protein